MKNIIKIILIILLIGNGVAVKAQSEMDHFNQTNIWDEPGYALAALAIIVGLFLWGRKPTTTIYDKYDGDDDSQFHTRY